MVKGEALTRARRMVIDAFAGLERPEEMTVANLRRCDDELWAGLVPDDAIVEPVNAGGVPALWVSAPGVSPDRVVVWFHGGGYSIGSASGRRAIGAEVSRAAGCKVLVPDFRLAPEHRFPAAVEDAVASYRWIIDQVDPSSVVLAGDSSGGGLALSTVHAARNADLRLPAAVVGLAPLTDMTLAGETFRLNKELDPMVTEEMLTVLIQRYLGDHDRRDPLASPLHGDLKGFPPVLLLVGAEEAVLDDSRRFARLVEEAGGQADLRVYPDMFHLWPFFAAVFPEARDAVDVIGAFVRKHTAASSAQEMGRG